jgi:DNA-binding NarL/FixJ family response regulator
MSSDSGTTITVSIVEDDSQARRIFCEWVRQAKDFRCLGSYATGEGALRQIPAQKPHVVLTDINLPGMTGIELVRQLKILLPQTQFLVITVYEDADHIFEALTAGATGYLLKQTSSDKLLAALRSVYSGDSPMSGTIARKVVQYFHTGQGDASACPTVPLTPREHQVLEFLVGGYLYKEIAEKLGVAVPTVCGHIRKVYEKLHVNSRGQAVAKYKHL